MSAKGNKAQELLQNCTFILLSPIQKLYFCSILFRHSATFPNVSLHEVYLFIHYSNKNNILSHI